MSVKKVRFYSATEMAELHSILKKTKMGTKERSLALENFGLKYRRARLAVYSKAYAITKTLKKRSHRQHLTLTPAAETTTFTGNTVSIPYKGLTIKDGHLVFDI